ncbi:MAG: ABC transporter substrate-binding protein [Spirochaetales bacterium]|nr:ABC transporter substrate-binding protein [Spirochaetales bacterium]
MNWKKFTVSICIVCMVSVGMLWAAGVQEAEGGDDTVLIGVSAPITGDFAANGNYIRTGLIYGASVLNENGGIKGREVELVIEDSKGDPSEGVLIAQRFIQNDDIVAVVGDFSSSVSMAAAEIYQQAGMTQISPTASHPGYSKIGDYIFRAGTTQSSEGPFLAQWAVEDLGHKDIATVYINSDWGVVANKYFVEEVEALGGTITNQENYITGDKDFQATITKIRQSDPDMVFLAMPWADAGAIISQMGQVGYLPPMMGPGQLSTNDLIEMTGDYSEGLRANAVYFKDDVRPVSRNFTDGYYEMWDVYPHDHAALAYDALMIVAEAMEKSGFDRDAIRDEVAKTAGYDGVTGGTTFDEYGDSIKQFIKIQILDGEWQVEGGK